MDFPIDLAWSGLACTVRPSLTPVLHNPDGPFVRAPVKQTWQNTSGKHTAPGTLTIGWGVCWGQRQGADTFRGLLQVTDKHTMLSKQILHPTSGMVVPGELMALVGPSGAGEHDLPLTSLCLQLFIQPTFETTCIFASILCVEGQEERVILLRRQVNTAGYLVAAQKWEAFWPGERCCMPLKRNNCRLRS